ncbi:hypothetical protein [Apilactobacillus ozensis]|uniref:hypothetical protein n=1 Tax=Apilactobacillus ozensis TaxID=866801 RepID=UPI00200A0241|nr:hypothetical protein [Apilactobacillus ozensis]MCK8607791.1 hypothetical protein [Apilactobacillus ozensis]
MKSKYFKFLMITFIAFIVLLISLTLISKNKTNKDCVKIYNPENKLVKLIKDKRQVEYFSTLYGEKIGNNVMNNTNIPKSSKIIYKIKIEQNDSNKQGEFNLYNNGYSSSEIKQGNKKIIWKMSKNELKKTMNTIN